MYVHGQDVAHLLTLIDGQYLGFLYVFHHAARKEEEDPLTIQHLNALLDVIYFHYGVIYTPLTFFCFSGDQFVAL